MSIFLKLRRTKFLERFTLSQLTVFYTLVCKKNLLCTILQSKYFNSLIYYTIFYYTFILFILLIYTFLLFCCGLKLFFNTCSHVALLWGKTSSEFSIMFALQYNNSSAASPVHKTKWRRNNAKKSCGHSLLFGVPLVGCFFKYFYLQTLRLLNLEVLSTSAGCFFSENKYLGEK